MTVETKRSAATHASQGLTRCVFAGGWILAVCLGFVTRTWAQEMIPGVQMSITVYEVLSGDPPETARIDSTVADIPFDRETTLRAGNGVYHLTAKDISSTSVALQYSFYRYGPTTTPKFDDARVEYGIPMIIDSIPGKGKSTFRALIVPNRTDMHVSHIPSLDDTTGWHVAPGTYHEFYAPPFSLAIFHAPRIKSALESELNALRDTFNLKNPGRTTFYITEGDCPEFPFDPRTKFAIDPSRNRVIVQYDKEQSGVDVRATLLTLLYRWWGYAPELLAIGASGFFDFSDYDVMAERRAGRSIALDSLVHTIDFKRCDADVAFHHAASFVSWLIRMKGMDRFRDLYGKSTDLSLRRACWAVYQQTLGELEADWIDYLDLRTFTSSELHTAALRSRAYRRLDRHLALLEEAVAAGHPAEPEVYYDLGLAQSHLGNWAKASEAFYWLYKRFPEQLMFYTLLGEAYWSQGDWVDAALVFNHLREQDSANGLAFLRLGDIQYDLKRVDSAVTLWRTGLSLRISDRTEAELLLRIGRRTRQSNNGIDAKTYFGGVLKLANGLLPENFGDPSLWALGGEAYLELDSLETALKHLEQAQFLADAVVDLAHIHRLTGQCYDRMGRRDDAVREYERVFDIPSCYIERRAAKQFINKPYTGQRLN